MNKGTVFLTFLTTKTSSEQFGASPFAKTFLHVDILIINLKYRIFFIIFYTHIKIDA